MSCIFEKSKYYSKAFTDTSDIIEPIGYDFLTKKQNDKWQKKYGQNVNKFIIDKPITKVLSNRKTGIYNFQQILKITDIQRKNYYISNNTFDFLCKQAQQQILKSMKDNYIPNMQQKYHIIQLASLLSNISKQHLLHIQDYSLSRYYFFMQGIYNNYFDYIQEMFQKEFIQYYVQGFYSALSNNSKGNYYPRPKLQQVQNKVYVENMIKKINKQAQIKDPLYVGFHFFIGIDTFKNNLNQDILKQQLSYLPYLQYYLTLMTGILADGQSAVIALRGTFRHKTNQFIYLLKLMFNAKVYLIKPLGSNIFNNQKYILCQDYSKQSGNIIHLHLLQNYNLLKQYKQQKLLINPLPMYKQQIQTLISNFNDTVIFKGLKYHFKQFKQNSNIKYYPLKNKLLQKLQNMPTMNNIIIQYINQLIPQFQQNNHQNQKNQKRQKKIIQKQASLDILQLALIQDKDKVKDKQKQKDKDKLDKQKKQKDKNQGSFDIDQFFKERQKQKIKKKKNNKKQI